MAPMYGNYDFSSEERLENDGPEYLENGRGLDQMAFWYMIALITMLLLWLIIFFCLRLIALRQKTRSQQPRRMYGGVRRARESLGPPHSPTVYVSPSNLPPPPKYDFAPPSYDEVVGIHYPQYSAQPITQPITAALACQSQGPSQPASDNVTSVTVVNESRGTVTVAST